MIQHGDVEAEGDVTVTGVYKIGIQDQAFGPESAWPCPTAKAASTSTSRRSGSTSTAIRWRRASACRPRWCGSTSPGSAERSAAVIKDLSMQIHGALLALHTKRPVKIVYNREESFFGHVHRHPARIWCEHRATTAGEFVSVRMKILLDGGAYASSSTAVTSNAACFAIGPYKVANALIESTCVYTNNLPRGAMRGFGVSRPALPPRRRWTSSRPS